jgi:EAL domain-containing protein (putative c-di-GMP-specific phosphodiesterase class I)
MAHERFFLSGMNVCDGQGEVYHQELFVRLRTEQGQVVSAGMFMPVAAMLDLDYLIDKHVLAKTLKLAQSSQSPLAINLSHTVLSSASALAEFEQFIRHYAELGDGSLHVEVSHHILNEHLVAAQHVADMLRQYGFYFGVEHLELGAELGSIQQVRPQYIKLNASRLDDMLQGSGMAALQALRSMAQSLDIELIAIGVDTDEMRQRLQAVGIEKMLGHIISPIVEHP